MSLGCTLLGLERLQHFLDIWVIRGEPGFHLDMVDIRVNTQRDKSDMCEWWIQQVVSNWTQVQTAENTCRWISLVPEWEIMLEFVRKSAIILHTSQVKYDYECINIYSISRMSNWCTRCDNMNFIVVRFCRLHLMWSIFISQILYDLFVY